LLASGTEIVCALDAGDRLVGRSHECDNPVWVRSLPACSEPAFDVSGSSRDIDREVNRRFRAGEPLYRIYSDRIRALAPDLIIAQSHCEVCAVTPGDVERSGTIPGARVMALSAASVEGIFATMLDIAEALGLEERGRELVKTRRARLERVRNAAAVVPRRSIVVLEWTDPIYPAGNWIPELVDAANGELLLGNPGDHSVATAAERLKAADPDCVVIAPCGFDLHRSIQELPVLEQYAWWRDLRAVREGRVAFADGNLLFNRSGMTITHTAEVIAEILHGVVIGESAQGQRWRWMRDVRVPA
jgi:iron complex transport system substrate-binding protein